MLECARGFSLVSDELGPFDSNLNPMMAQKNQDQPKQPMASTPHGHFFTETFIPTNQNLFQTIFIILKIVKINWTVYE